MIPKLLTDARETSYWIRSSLLTAECSTVELPGNCATSLFSFGFILLHRTNSCHNPSVAKLVLSSRGSCSHALQAIALSRAYGAALQISSLRSPVHSVQLAVFDKETGKRTHCLYRLGTASFLVTSSQPKLRKPRNLSQRRRWVAHIRPFGSRPKGRCSGLHLAFRGELTPVLVKHTKLLADVIAVAGHMPCSGTSNRRGSKSILTSSRCTPQKAVRFCH
jgi:hypothetical protein